MKSLRILIVTQYFWPENFKINDLVDALCDLGHRVTVLTGRPNYPDGHTFECYLKNPAAFSQRGDASIVRVPLVPRGTSRVSLAMNFISFAVSASIIGTWKLRGRSFDSIFVYQPSPITVGIPGAVLRSVKGASLILWVQDLWPETLTAVNAVRSRSILFTVECLVRFIYRHCDLILTQSRTFVPRVRRYAPESTRIEYFPGWAEAVIDPDTADDPPEIPADGKKFRVMFAGNIGEAQDFPAILDAVELLVPERSIEWLIVGDGRMSAWVRDAIVDRNLFGAIRLLGRFPLERMPSFFRRADALLVSLKDDPIFSMTVPSKLQSYLAAGVPIVAMVNGEASEIVQRARCGVTCRAGDSEGLAAAVSQLAAMTLEERRTMGENGRRFSAEEFGRSESLIRLQAWMHETASALTSPDRGAA